MTPTPSRSPSRRTSAARSITVRVAPDDMGKVIGRGGRTAKAIRSVVRAAATRQGVSAHVDIAD